MSEKGGERRFVSNLGNGLIIAGIGAQALMIPSSLQADAFSSVSPYDRTMEPSTSSTPNIRITPTDTDTPTFSPTTAKLETSVQPTASRTTPAEGSCVEGEPREVALSGFFGRSPVENVTTTSDGSAVAAPTGRDASGAYNTVGFYKEGALPGAEVMKGKPFFLLHSTIHEHSLLYPNGEVMKKIRLLKKLGSTTILSVYQKNGTLCRYDVHPERIWVVKEEAFRPLMDKLDTQEPGDPKEAFIVACANTNPDTGEPGNYRMVMLGEAEK